MAHSVLHSVSGIWDHTGGPAESIPNLCAELTKHGVAVTLATLEGKQSAATLACAESGVDLKTFPVALGSPIWYSPALSRAIRVMVGQTDIVHGHGLWLYTNWVTGKHARRARKPLVITPRGCLQFAALKHSRWKKRLAGILMDNRNLRYASCIHVTSEEEYESVRAYGLKNPVAVVPNGINAAAFSNLPYPERLYARFPELEQKNVFLYLSRISWEKGLPMLLQAWCRLASEFPHWHLLVAGHGEPLYERQMQQLSFQLGIQSRITWAGLLAGKDKHEALSASRLLVLPTLSENFGLVLAEALAAGIPVLTTQRAPWPDIVEARCGWWVETEQGAIGRALEEALRMSSSERETMGQRGTSLVKGKYAWETVAQKMLSVYEWILGCGDTVDYVRIK